jgi:peptidoglycan/xylan/chitin deacetylase (PgdA/CDA1 family)
MKRAQMMQKPSFAKAPQISLEPPSPLLPGGIHAVILTHDVDWPRKGPRISHILSRRARFDPKIMNRVIKEGFNPYFGVLKVAEVEEQFGVRSTFFFRPAYDDESKVDEYEDTIGTLIKNGWEVGLHANNTSTFESVMSEKNSLERIANRRIFGSRVHYLRVSSGTFRNLAAAEIKYDSSITFDNESIGPRNSGCVFRSDLVVFPITFMDAYLFTYKGLTEKTITKFIVKKIRALFSSGVQITTLLWHDNSIMMHGGRVYSDVIKHLADQIDATFLKGIDAFELIQKWRPN